MSKSMENSSRYFKNEKCEYFPCHKGNSDEFNCLFCYCPLYNYNCPGNFKIIETKAGMVKSCMDCRFPHIPGNYDKIMQILKDNVKNKPDSLFFAP